MGRAARLPIPLPTLLVVVAALAASPPALAQTQPAQLKPVQVWGYQVGPTTAQELPQIGAALRRAGINTIVVNGNATRSALDNARRAAKRFGFRLATVGAEAGCATTCPLRLAGTSGWQVQYVPTPSAVSTLRFPFGATSRIALDLPLGNAAFATADWQRALKAARSLGTGLIVRAVPTKHMRTARTAFLRLLAALDVVPPTAPTGLAVASFDASSVSVGWKAATDNRLVKSYAISLDDGNSSQTSSLRFVFSGLLCGTVHIVAVTAVDAAGNVSPAASLRVATAKCSAGGSGGATPGPSAPTGGGTSTTTEPADTLPPTAPLVVSLAGATTTTLALTWPASTDDVGVAGYAIFLGSTNVGQSRSTSAVVSGLVCGTTYAVGVAAFDAAGNRSAVTTASLATASCAAASDTTPPTAPGRPTITGATASSLAVSWTAATDDTGVVGYTVYVNGSVGDTTAGTSLTLNGLACGTTFTIGVTAFDAAGNRSSMTTAPGTTSACPDTTAPTVPGGLAAGSASASSASLSWTAATDNIGVTGYTVYNGGVAAGTTSSTGYTVSGLSCGTTYSLSVDAYDAAGNHSAKATVSATTSVCPSGGSAANVFVSTTGSDAGAGCVRFATATTSWPAAAAACATMTKALALAQPGDVVQLEAGTYPNVTISRQSGADSPLVVVRGDPAMVDQFGCASDTCAEGNVVVNNLVVCGHGLSVQNLDSKATDQTYFYVGDNSCPVGSGNQITANHDIELHNVHFTQATLRGTNVGMYHSRLGPQYDLCGSPAARSDLLHIWPDTSGHAPVNVTVDHSVIWYNNMSTQGCGGAHADNIQLLGVNGLTFTNNIVGAAADDLWTDGSLNGTTESGPILIANNFFDNTDTINGNSVGVQFGLNQDGSATCNATYTIENNTFANGKNVTLKCNSGTATWYGNYLHMSTNVSSTCGSGTFDYNVFDSTSVLCGSHAKTCAPTWLYATANSLDLTHGWDLHLAPTDTCLVGAGSPTNHALTDIDGTTRPTGTPTDAGADETP